MSSRRHRKGLIGADSLYKQEFFVLHCIFMSSCRHWKGCIGADSLYKQEFLSYIVFSCLPVGTGRVVSVLIVNINKNFLSYIVFFMSSLRHRKGPIGDKINVIELQRCYFWGKWEYNRGCR